jgi:putative two-component system response regulator
LRRRRFSDKSDTFMTSTSIVEGSTARGQGLVLIVDDLDVNLRLFRRLLEPEGYVVLVAEDGNTAVEMVRQHLPDLVLTDVRMPGCDGFELCQMLKVSPETRLIPVVLMTGATEREDRLKAFAAGADDLLSKPVDAVELRARVKSLVRIKRFTDDLDSAETVLRTIALMIEARDPMTEGHCHRLANYAVALGAALGFSEDDQATLRRGAYFHDIGKVAIPDALLLKPGPLTAEEYGRMKQHTIIGERLCQDVRVLRPVRSIVRSHHELLDGSGYPDGLRGDAIPILAQVIGIVDVFDAITRARPYKPALSHDVACRELERDVQRGRRAASLVDVWVSLVRGGLVTSNDDVGLQATVNGGVLP